MTKTRHRQAKNGAARRERPRTARPSPVKAALLLTILTAFTFGAMAGALCTARGGPRAMLLPSAALLLAALYAFFVRSRTRSTDR